MSVEENKRVSSQYHKFNVAEMDTILTPDFIGHGTKGFSWNLENHKQAWSTLPTQMRDTIQDQIGEGDWVTTRFVRSGDVDGKAILWEGMQLKRFVNGKIAEIWEVFDLS